MKPYDTIIIGAGPVGSRVAYKLAQLNYKVIVLDKKAAPGDDACCTGILSKEFLDAFDIDTNLILRESSSAKFFSPSGKCLRLRRDSPVAAIVDRSALDKRLARQAQEVGADYLFEARVTDIKVGADTVETTVDSQGGGVAFNAKTAVIATGFGSTLPERLGLGKIKHFLLGAQIEVDTNIDEVEVYFDQNLAPCGFAWLVPTEDGKGLAGLLTRCKADFYLKSLLDTLSSQDKLTSTKVTTSYGSIPLRPLPKTYSNRILVVGEAAGQVKPTTGGGVYYGLLCADMATDVLHQAFLSGNFSAAKLSAYQKQWQTKLSRELTIGYWIRRLYYHLNNRSIDCLFQIAIKKGMSEIVNAKDFSFDWHSRVLFQIVRTLSPFHSTVNEL